MRAVSSGRAAAYGRRRALAVAALVVVVAAIVVLILRLTGGSGPDDALDGFLGTRGATGVASDEFGGLGRSL
jgi:hypothetical protein